MPVPFKLGSNTWRTAVNPCVVCGRDCGPSPKWEVHRNDTGDHIFARGENDTYAEKNGYPNGMQVGSSCIKLVPPEYRWPYCSDVNGKPLVLNAGTPNAK